ncbi:hypothetical protein [Tepidimicrobium xylanilyticum]|uniref:Uncharacterized protein n=1 Tax=Tepidimicrobium xylanilyticum TaxID=1123352 RepID=A0A1H2V8T9_9FIRM|nr:hypothetical protein [Tepidimicrobium xylanilyticum]GMG96708.1 hypothetical protein EN5CB1_15340 [Tepidimicrobium xylanilyticum]SDW64279.1 hypothetical protein SAMN05660923_01040 [Tepidimicrobium xylanilyticum]
MKNQKAIGEILDQTKKIDENNWNTTQCLNNINMLLTSNDLGRTKDDELSKKFEELNSKIEDINKITSDLLEDLSRRHN